MSSCELLKALSLCRFYSNMIVFFSQPLGHEILLQAQKEAEEMKARSKTFDISVSQLRLSESRLSACEKRCKQLEWKNEVRITSYVCDLPFWKACQDLDES